MRSILLKKRRDMQKEDRSVENCNSNSVIATFDDVEVEKVKESEERQQMKSNKSLSSFTIEKVQKMSRRELSEDDIQIFQKLIHQGRDQEIYLKVYGERGFERRWPCAICDGGSFFGSSKAFVEHFFKDLRHAGDRSEKTDCKKC